MGFFGKIVGKAVNDAIYKASDGKKPVSTDYSRAAINIIKRRIENITLFVSIISFIIFLGFYGFMIYSKHDSVVNVITYAILAFLLIVSTTLDIILFKASRKEMNFLEKKNFNLLKKLKRNSLLIFKLVVKLFSIGFAIFEIIRYDDHSTGRIIGVSFAILALAFQLIIHYLACFINDCINYIVLGLEADVDNSGILFLVDKNKHEKTASNELLRTRSEEKILEELEEQKKKDSHIKDDDDEIKIKFGKYQLECKSKAKDYLKNDKKLNKLISSANSRYESTHIANSTPVEVLKMITLVSDTINKKYDKLSSDDYLNAIAFVIYYINYYDTSKVFGESNEVYILNKIFDDIKGFEDYLNSQNEKKAEQSEK